MVFVQDMVQAALAKGFEPAKQGKKNVIMMKQCPECGRPKMVKFLLKTDNRAFVLACTCGYRDYTNKARRALNSEI